MIAIAAAALTLNPLFLRHDLMIELGRLEMALQDVRTTVSANDQEPVVNQLETRRARVSEALSRLPV